MKTILASVSIAVTLAVVPAAKATLLFSEAFNYSAGGLVNNANPGGGTWTGGNSGLNIVSGNLTYSGLADQGGNSLQINNGAAGTSYITFANQTSGQVYYSFLFNASVVDSANTYFTAMNPGTSVPNGSSDAIDVYYNSTGKLAVRGAAQAASSGTGAALTLNTTYFIVEMIDLDAHTASLWINPTPGAAAPTVTASLSGLTATAVDNVGFKAQAGTGTFVVDNLLIGTTWGDVTPTPTPEPSTLALTGLGLVSLMILKRRK
jgi:hypothetical protein